jgi:hypothetical protein
LAVRSQPSAFSQNESQAAIFGHPLWRGNFAFAAHRGAPIKEPQNSAHRRAADKAQSLRFSRVTAIISRVCRGDFCNFWKRGFCRKIAKVDGETSGAVVDSGAALWVWVELSKNGCIYQAANPDIGTLVHHFNGAASFGGQLFLARRGCGDFSPRLRQGVTLRETTPTGMVTAPPAEPRAEIRAGNSQMH